MKSNIMPGPWEQDEPGSALITAFGVPVIKVMDNFDTQEQLEAHIKAAVTLPDFMALALEIVYGDGSAANHQRSIDMAYECLRKAGIK